MCGINGFTLEGSGNRGDSLTVERMNEQLAHRGPDEGGTILHGRCALGMRRLSIIDVVHGHQPMQTRDGRYAIVYNGELYDYKQMRAQLEARGIAFETHADTEVVLRSYATDGLACLDRFNGMFAFAISDAMEGSLLLVRDQIGIKPLYYYLAHDGNLVFSSELGSLISHSAVPRRLDHDSLATLLVDRWIAEPFTLFEHIFQLPPGHWLRWADGKVEVQSYYEFFPQPEPLDDTDALEELRERLRETVRSQLVADVPVAAFLSGGIDSSTVAAFASRELGTKLHTFTVGFANREYDESHVARAVATHVGSTHHELLVEDSSFDPGLMERIVRHIGQPLVDTSCIPTLLVSDFASDYVKVVLSGDGGDEFFGGYRHILWAARIRRASRWPGWTRRMANVLLAAIDYMPNPRWAVTARRTRKALALTFCDPIEIQRRLGSLWLPEELPSFLASPPKELRPVSVRSFVDPLKVSPEEFAMDYLAKTSMVNGILRKVDRMSMAASLEVRVPLLDRRVFEFALRLPLNLKVRGDTGKYLLRESARPWLPDAVFSHPKQGFSPPLQDWFNDRFWILTRDLCRPGTDIARLFRRRELDRMLDDGMKPYDHQVRVSYDAASARAWLIAQLGVWLRMYKISL